MSTYTLSEAKAKLSDLIDRAIGGEDVVITRDGAPAVELKAVQQRKARPINKADLDALRRNRIRLKPGAESPTETLRKMRDEY